MAMKTRALLICFSFISICSWAVNSAPTDISLSASTIPENSATATLVGNLSASDIDLGDVQSFSLVAGVGSADNASFSIVGTSLKNSAVFDFETKSSYSIRIRADDGNGGTFDKVFSVTVTDVNETPDYNNASATIAENLANSTNVIILTGTDVDAGQTLSYFIISGNTGNAFAVNSISGQVYVNISSAVDFETTPVFTLGLRATDNGAPVLFKDATLTINLTNVNDAPAITVPGAKSVFENTNLTVAGISINDQDISTDSLSVCVSSTHGFISLSSIAGLNFSSGDGSSDAAMCFTGKQANVNTALNNLIYKSVDDYVGADALAISVNDDGHNGPGGIKSDLKSIAITVNPVSVSFITQPVNDTVCQTRNTLFFVKATGTNPLTFQWKHNGVNIAGATDDTLYLNNVALADSFQYRCVVTNPAGSFPSSLVQLKVYGTPKLTFTSTEVCLGSVTNHTNSSTIDIDSIASYSWDFANAGGVSSLFSPTYTYTADGTFNVSLIGTSSYGCKDTLIQAVVVDPMPQIAFAFGDICFVDSLRPQNLTTINLGTVSYLWDFGDGSSSVNANPKHKYVSTDSYIVGLRATSNKGCVRTLSKTITVNPSPIANFVVTDICDSTNAKFQSVSSISSGTMDLMWDFADGSTLPNDVNPEHFYVRDSTYNIQLSVLSDKGCTDTVVKPLKVFPNPKPVFSIVDVDCAGSLNGAIYISTSSGLQPYFYSLDAGIYQFEPSFPSLSGGIHQVVVLDFRNCKTVRNVTINEPTPLTASYTQAKNPVCSGTATGSIEFTAQGGVHPYVFTNKKEGEGTLTQNTGYFANLKDGDYETKIFDANGCYATIAYQLNEPTPLLIDIAKENISCLGLNDGSISIAASGANGGYSYSIDDGIHFYVTPDFTDLAAGNYLTTVKDFKGCSYSKGVTIVEPSSVIDVSASVFKEILCKGDSAGSIKLYGTGGSGVIEYAKNTTATFVYSNQFDDLFTGDYRFYAKDQNACVDSIDIHLSEPALPLSIAYIDEQDITCFGKNDGEINIHALGGNGAYHYSIYGMYQSSAVFKNLHQGNYLAKVKDDLGCLKSQWVSIQEPLVLNLSLDNIIGVDCKNESSGEVMLSVSGGNSAYSFFIDDVPALSPFNGLTGGEHDVFVNDSKGCNFDTLITVPFNKEVAIADFTSFVAGKVMTVNNQSQYADLYSWTFSDVAGQSSVVSPIHSFAHNGIYEVTLVASNSCNSDTLKQSVIIGAIGLVENNTEGIQCSVFPSPSSTQVTLKITASELVKNEAVQIHFFDVLGKELYQQNTFFDGNFLKLDIPVNSLAEGKYLLKVSSDSINIVRSFIVQY